MNIKKIEEAVKIILEEIGEKVEREGLLETPTRVAKAFLENFYGLTTPPPAFKLFKSDYAGIVVKIFKFSSWCEHHLTLIEFEISFGYIPSGYVIGISKIIKRVKWLAARPIIQENLTDSIIEDFEKELNPSGVIVILKGRHFCELTRGVKTNSWTTTSSVRGIFADSKSGAREEFLSLIK